MISVIIPTHNRPKLLVQAVRSVLAQTYHDLEVIIVDDGMEQRAAEVVGRINDPRARYIAHDRELGGSAARNTGVKAAHGDYIAFLDDDDQWLPQKLEVQMAQFEQSPADVGFCVCAVTNVYDDHEENSVVPDGVGNYFDLALGNFRGFLTVTLIIKKYVLDDVGGFNESLPSHQETDLILRIAKKYKGVLISQPLVRVNMKGGHQRTGSNVTRKIAGREMILKKYFDDFKKDPDLLALNYFWLGLLYRKNKQYNEARKRFVQAMKTRCTIRYVLHYLSMTFAGLPYRLIR